MAGESVDRIDQCLAFTAAEELYIIMNQALNQLWFLLMWA